MATIAMAQSPPVLDADRRPLRSGVKYHVLPAATDTAGGLTLISRNDSCPLYVGQEPLSEVVSQGFPLILTSRDGDSVIREGRDFKIVFSAATICVQPTAWTVGEADPKTSRRFIVTGGDKDYFNIGKHNGLYNFRWCPNCPSGNCPKPRCGDAGIVIENGKRLFVLDGPAFPFQFRRVTN
ncbi:hypothetical protein JCGZ_21018 [Jatropha curcas]|uniref:Uncharacterized protein n=2 Tax=Jatropha curcas TaxID=180498 RepID=A0A067JTT4_JATCU|nr:hypothetical protein JCGZ_21018 [Jatropha curcas]